MPNCQSKLERKSSIIAGTKCGSTALQPLCENVCAPTTSPQKAGIDDTSENVDASDRLYILILILTYCSTKEQAIICLCMLLGLAHAHTGTVNHNEVISLVASVLPELCSALLTDVGAQSVTGDEALLQLLKGKLEICNSSSTQNRMLSETNCVSAQLQSLLPHSVCTKDLDILQKTHSALPVAEIIMSVLTSNSAEDKQRRDLVHLLSQSMHLLKLALAQFSSQSTIKSGLENASDIAAFTILTRPQAPSQCFNHVSSDREDAMSQILHQQNRFDFQERLFRQLHVDDICNKSPHHMTFQVVQDILRRQCYDIDVRGCINDYLLRHLHEPKQQIDLGTMLCGSLDGSRSTVLGYFTEAPLRSAQFASRVLVCLITNVQLTTPGLPPVQAFIKVRPDSPLKDEHGLSNLTDLRTWAPIRIHPVWQSMQRNNSSLSKIELAQKFKPNRWTSMHSGPECGVDNVALSSNGTSAAYFNPCCKGRCCCGQQLTTIHGLLSTNRTQSIHAELPSTSNWFCREHRWCIVDGVHGIYLLAVHPASSLAPTKGETEYATEPLGKSDLATLTCSTAVYTQSAIASDVAADGDKSTPTESGAASACALVVATALSEQQIESAPHSTVSAVTDCHAMVGVVIDHVLPRKSSLSIHVVVPDLQPSQLEIPEAFDDSSKGKLQPEQIRNKEMAGQAAQVADSDHQMATETGQLRQLSLESSSGSQSTDRSSTQTSLVKSQATDQPSVLIVITALHETEALHAASHCQPTSAVDMPAYKSSLSCDNVEMAVNESEIAVKLGCSLKPVSTKSYQDVTSGVWPYGILYELGRVRCGQSRLVPVDRSLFDALVCHGGLQTGMMAQPVISGLHLQLVAWFIITECSKFHTACELLRLASFHAWPHLGQLSALSFSSAGFYYTGNGDAVTCFSCGFTASQWKAGMHPLAVHREKCGDRCQVVGERQTLMADISGNVPLSKTTKPPVSTSRRDDPESGLPAAAAALAGSHTDPAVQGLDASETASNSASGGAYSLVHSLLSATGGSLVKDSRSLTQGLSHPAGSTSQQQQRDEQIKSESYRLGTFANLWYYGHIVMPGDLARNGFFYAGSGDRVQCAFCQGVLRNWEPGDRAEEQHAQHFTYCRFVQGHDVGNMPIPFALLPTKPVDGTGIVADMTDNRREMDTFGITRALPKSSEFAVEARRLLTFATWSPTHHMQPDALAKAGFFFLGREDAVKCFFCDGIVVDWRVNCDPWVEHAQRFPTCTFLVQVKGLDFVQRHRVDEPPPSLQAQRSSFAVDPREIRARMDSPKVRVLLQMDYPLDLVREVVQKRLATIGQDHETCEELLADVFATHDEKQRATASQATASRRTASSEPLVVSLPGDGHSASSVNATSLPVAIAASALLARANGSLASAMPQASISETAPPPPPEPIRMVEPEEDNRQLKTQLTCKICMDSVVGIVFLPCGHLVCCAVCAPALTTCPICRVSIRGTVRTVL